MANTADRYVAFLDIMGFKDLVASSTHEQVLNKLISVTNCIDYIKKVNKDSEFKTKYRGVELIPYVFSDSIVIFTRNGSHLSGRALMFACQYIFEMALVTSFPMKGAIAYGTITLDRRKSIFFGQPLIDAYILQEELKYYGLILHNSTEKHIANSKSGLDYFDDLIIKSATTTKSGKINYYNLIMEHTRLSKAGEKPPEEILNSLYYSVSGAPRLYVDNTIEMYKSILVKEKETN